MAKIKNDRALSCSVMLSRFAYSFATANCHFLQLNCQQHLRGANIGCGLVSSDMLLSCLQSHPISGLSIGISRSANNSSRDVPFVLFFG